VGTWEHRAILEGNKDPPWETLCFHIENTEYQFQHPAIARYNSHSLVKSMRVSGLAKKKTKNTDLANVSSNFKGILAVISASSSQS